ncbi:trimeric intracellular cation channel family protein [Mycobacterium colombiense]
MAIAELTVTDLFRAVDLTGVFGNALLGGVVARREELDAVGFAALAVLSGLGGGIIRDTLLQRGTPVALTDFAYLLTALAGAAIAFVFRVDGRVWNGYGRSWTRWRWDAGPRQVPTRRSP